ncbi:MAG: uroporphyrinogen decarboxylase [Campylobacterales bacterium]|nr:uroporphyrinogen decarboxylase [Campylobacterales bacterium]
MIFIEACFKRQTKYTPTWMMRQAGRYLPEYMEVRRQAGNFLNLCKNPELACEVTLQPIDILDVDAAILFSDILVTPLEMGMDLKFEAGEGPVFTNPLKNEKDLLSLSEDSAKNLTYVYDAIKLIRQRLDKSKALIGFCGSPWTLSTYMIEGRGTKTFAKVKKEVYSNPSFMHKLLQLLSDSIKEYLENQIKAGVNAVMIFDSWASALEEDIFLEFSWSYMNEVASYLKSKYPSIPVILFPKGVSGYLDKIDGNFDVFGVDWSTPMELAKQKLGHKYVLQGNLEPCRLYNKDSIEEGVRKIVDVMGKEGGHIFNLGHGILPDIPVEHAKYFVQLVKELTARS